MVLGSLRETGNIITEKVIRKRSTFINDHLSLFSFRDCVFYPYFENYLFIYLSVVSKTQTGGRNGKCVESLKAVRRHEHRLIQTDRRRPG